MTDADFGNAAPPLLLCAKCRRHVHRTETQCPFCEEPLASSLTAARAIAAGAVLLALGASVAGCTREPAPVYGGPPPPPHESEDAGAAVSAPGDAAPD